MIPSKAVALPPADPDLRVEPLPDGWQFVVREQATGSWWVPCFDRMRGRVMCPCPRYNQARVCSHELAVTRVILIDQGWPLAV